MADEYFDAEVEIRPWQELLTWQRDHLPGYLSTLTDAVPFYRDRLAEVDVDRASGSDVWTQVPFTSGVVCLTSPNAISVSSRKMDISPSVSHSASIRSWAEQPGTIIRSIVSENPGPPAPKVECR